MSKKQYAPAPKNPLPLKKRKTNLMSPTPMYKTLSPEKKNIDVISFLPAGVDIGSSGSWSVPLLLNGVAVGGDPNQRIGRSTNMKSLLLRVTGVSTGPLMQNRVLVVYDRQTNGILPTAANILQTPTSSESPMNLGFSKRFVILADFYTNEQGFSSNIFMEPPQYRKLNLTQNYSGGVGGTVADIADGAVFLLWTSNALNANNPRLSIYSRIRYTDV